MKNRPIPNRCNVRTSNISILINSREQETKGRELYQFFPEVAGRLSMRWVQPDYVTSQILTGHGCFNKRLSDMKLREGSMCECGESEEDRHHVLWYCPLYEDLRWEMLSGIALSEGYGPAWYPDLISSEANFARLRGFAHAWHRRRNSQTPSGQAPDGANVPVESMPQKGESGKGQMDKE